MTAATPKRPRSDKLILDLSGFDESPIERADDVPSVLREEVPKLLDVICELTNPGGDRPESPLDRTVDALLCDVRYLCEGAARVLDGEQSLVRPCRDESRDDFLAAGAEYLAAAESKGATLDPESVAETLRFLGGAVFPGERPRAEEDADDAA